MKVGEVTRPIKSVITSKLQNSIKEGWKMSNDMIEVKDISSQSIIFWIKNNNFNIWHLTCPQISVWNNHRTRLNRHNIFNSAISNELELQMQRNLELSRDEPQIVYVVLMENLPEWMRPQLTKVQNPFTHKKQLELRKELKSEYSVYRLFIRDSVLSYLTQGLNNKKIPRTYDVYYTIDYLTLLFRKNNGRTFQDAVDELYNYTIRTCFEGDFK